MKTISVQDNPIDGRQRALTGGEIHAYRLHHLMTQRIIIPIPDLWLMLLAALVGKAIALYDQRQQNHAENHHPWRWLGLGIGGSLVYSLISLELYLSSIALLLPIGLPLVVLWVYLVPIALPSVSSQPNRRI